MKYTSSIVFAIGCLMAVSCGNSSAAGASDPAKSADAAESSASSSDGGFSCTLNGKSLNGVGSDESRFRNVAYLYPDAQKGDRALLMLYSGKLTDEKPDYFLHIRVLTKPGTYTVRESDRTDGTELTGVYLDLMSGDLSRYSARATGLPEAYATVTITSNDGKRLKGTFVMNLGLSNDTPRGSVKSMALTSGTFDVPFNTGKLMPE